MHFTTHFLQKFFIISFFLLVFIHHLIAQNNPNEIKQDPTQTTNQINVTNYQPLKNTNTITIANTITNIQTSQKSNTTNQQPKLIKKTNQIKKNTILKNQTKPLIKRFTVGAGAGAFFDNQSILIPIPFFVEWKINQTFSIGASFTYFPKAPSTKFGYLIKGKAGVHIPINELFEFYLAIEIIYFGFTGKTFKQNTVGIGVLGGFRYYITKSLGLYIEGGFPGSAGGGLIYRF